jgi:protein gp37
VSAACENCYAESIERRFSQKWYGEDWKPWTKANAAHSVRLHPERLEIPLRWREPRRLFVCSMGDLFHERVPEDFIVKVFAVMAKARKHTFQVLTKRAERMEMFVSTMSTHVRAEAKARGMRVRSQMQWIAADLWEWPLPNVWLGVSVENQRAADERIPHLLATPAAKRFISIEPMLGPVDIQRWLDPKGAPGYCFDIDNEWWHDPGSCSYCRPTLDWVIVGGESGPKARPMHPAWPRSIRDQCQAAGVPFFFKNWGEWAPRPDCPD